MREIVEMGLVDGGMVLCEGCGERLVLDGYCDVCRQIHRQLETRWSERQKFGSVVFAPGVPLAWRVIEAVYGWPWWKVGMLAFSLLGAAVVVAGAFLAGLHFVGALLAGFGQ